MDQILILFKKDPSKMTSKDSKIKDIQNMFTHKKSQSLSGRILEDFQMFLIESFEFLKIGDKL